MQGILIFKFRTGTTALRDAPFAGIYIFFYENLRTMVSKLNSASNIRPLVNMGSGIIAGFAATVITHPFDVLKTRIQLEPLKYRNFFQAGKHIWNTTGIHGFFRGIIPRLLRKSLSSAIAWTFYEEIILISKR